MRRERNAGSGILVTAAVFVLLATIMPMAVQAQNQINTTPVPAYFGGRYNTGYGINRCCCLPK
jgi:hypothetical protein